MLSMALCFTMIIPVPAFAENEDDESFATEQNKTIGNGIYVANEVIVCYADPEDVDKTALEKEIVEDATGESIDSEAPINKTEDVDDAQSEEIIGARIEEVVDNASKEEKTEINEKLEMVEIVNASDDLSDLGDTSIKKMKGIKKRIIKAKKVKQGIARQRMGLLKPNKFFKKYSVEEMVSKLEALPNVEFAQPNYINVPLAVTDTTWSQQWAYDGNSKCGLNIPNWNDPNNLNAEGVVVAVLDTGVDYNHQDISGAMWTDGTNYPVLVNKGGGMYGYNSETNSQFAPNNPMDDQSHGTHCAGIIGAVWNNTGISGAANGVKIMAVKAGGKDGLSDADLISGMEYIREAKNAGVNVVAVNNSWGAVVPTVTADTAIVKEINSLADVGVMCIFAAGNEGRDCDAYETAYIYEGKPYRGYWQSYWYHGLANTVIVGSNGPSGDPAKYTSYGRESVDVFAPGGDSNDGGGLTGAIYSTVLNNGYDYKEGTSMACPAVTGAVAILRAQYPNASFGEIKEALIDNSRLGLGDSNALVGVIGKCVANGYVDVERALNALGETTVIIGDIDRDRNVTLDDGIEFCNRMVTNTMNDKQIARMDCNGDKKVNVLDAVSLYNKLETSKDVNMYISRYKDLFASVYGVVE